MCWVSPWIYESLLKGSNLTCRFISKEKTVDCLRLAYVKLISPFEYLPFIHVVTIRFYCVDPCYSCCHDTTSTCDVLLVKVRACKHGSHDDSHDSLARWLAVCQDPVTNIWCSSTWLALPRKHLYYISNLRLHPLENLPLVGEISTMSCSVCFVIFLVFVSVFASGNGELKYFTHDKSSQQV